MYPIYLKNIDTPTILLSKYIGCTLFGKKSGTPGIKVKTYPILPVFSVFYLSPQKYIFYKIIQGWLVRKHQKIGYIGYKAILGASFSEMKIGYTSGTSGTLTFLTKNT